MAKECDTIKIVGNLPKNTLIGILQHHVNYTDITACRPCNWKQIATITGRLNAGIRCNGTLWTWGSNTTSLPKEVPGGGTNWCQVSLGRGEAVRAIKTDGTLWTWDVFCLGIPCGSPVTVVGGGTTWCRVASGYNHDLALKTDGTLWTWGCNGSGILGDGTTVNRCSPGTVAAGGTNWCQISAYFNSAAIKTDGTLWTWGYGGSGYLGDGTTVGRCSPGTTAGGGTNWCQVRPGRFSMSAVKTDGTLWTWGYGQCGVHGNGATTQRCSPGTVWGSYTTWCQVSSSHLTTVAIKTDGTLWTWGWDRFGIMGNDLGGNRCSPGTIWGGGNNWCQASTSNYRVSAIKTDGTMWGWGYNRVLNAGTLGDGTTLDRYVPVPVFTLSGTSSSEEFLLLASSIDSTLEHRQVSVASTNDLPNISTKQISNGQIIFVDQINAPVIAKNECWLGLDGRVLRSDVPTRTLFSWGCNNGALGDGTTVSRCSPGTVAGGGTTWCLVSDGYCHSSAIKTDGTLWTWGDNFRGYLGDGTTTFRNSPGTVAGGGTTWCKVSSGNYTVAAIKNDGTLWTWGYGGKGALGNGTTVSRCSPGTIWGGGTNWCQVSSGKLNTFAIKTDGTLWSWGYNLCGSLGDRTTVNRCSPGTTTGGGTNWCQVSAGVYQVSAIKTDGTLWTWGSNYGGSLGDGTTLKRCSPGTIWGGGTTWCQFDIGRYIMSAIKTDGTLWTWGYNTKGQLGNGSTVDRCSPGTVAGGGTTWCQSSVSLGSAYSAAAIKTDGTLWTWGGNHAGLFSYGSLGDGTTVNRCSPGTIAGGGTNWCLVSVGKSHMFALKKE